VRVSSSFAEGVLCLGSEPFDLVFLEQGSSLFEGREVLAHAMEIDPEIRVVILARSYHQSCFLEAMQSGALDYFEKALDEADIAALLDTFIPCRRARETAICRAQSFELGGSSAVLTSRRGKNSVRHLQPRGSNSQFANFDRRRTTHDP
jgi:DNA-binding NtrC family response regulator